MSENPFIPFIPARGEKFVNRINELNQIFENISKGNNTSLLGYPRNGKTSVLKKIEESFGNFNQSKDIVLVYINIELMEENDSPKQFWSWISSQAVNLNSNFSSELDLFVGNTDFNYHSLFSGFELLGKNKKRVVALIDEFEKCLDKKGLATCDFIDTIRAISKDTGGFCFVSASRQPLSYVNDQLNTNGSRFDVDEIILRGFDITSIDNWLINNGLNTDVIGEMKFLGSSYPALLQLIGNMIWPLRNESTEIRLNIHEDFFSKTRRYFDEIWEYLNGKSQLVLTLLIIKDFEGKVAEKAFRITKINSLLFWLSQELIDLQNIGILERNGRDYKIGSSALKIWLIRTKIADALIGDLTATTWLQKNEYKIKPDLLTQKDLDLIWNAIKTIAPSAIDIAKTFSPTK